MSAELWTQRELLESLLYRLVTQQLVLTSGSTRWLAKADDDVRAAVEFLRASEVSRAMHVGALLDSTGGDADRSLQEIAAAAPDMWRHLLTDHRVALRELAFEIERVAGENQRLLQAGANTVRDTLAGIGNVVRRYDSRGTAVQEHPGAMLLDEQA